MCIKIIERYTVCGCLYYSHAVNPCPAFGRHEVKVKEVLVGYNCSHHSHLSISTSRQDIIRKQSSLKSITFSNSNCDGLTTEFSESRDMPGSWESDAESEGGSETSELWDSGSVTSISTTSTVDPDVIEATFYRLLFYGNLEFFWPQVVARCGSRKESCHVIERFLRRFADDLGNIAVSSVEGNVFSKAINNQRSASTFIRRSRFELAQRICEAYHYRTLKLSKTAPFSSDRANEFVKSGSLLDAVENEEEVEEITLIDDAVKIFLFETEPICRLEENVQAFLRKDPPQPLGHTFLEAIEICWDEIVSLLRKSRLFKWLERGSERREILEEGISSREARPENGYERSAILEEELWKKTVSWTCVELTVVT